MRMLHVVPMWVWSLSAIAGADPETAPQQPAVRWCVPAAEGALPHCSARRTVVVGNPVFLRIDGVPAGAHVSVQAGRKIHAQLLGGAIRWFEAHARFRANRQGQVWLDRDAPLQGSYSGADPNGLFWSMVSTTQTPPAHADYGVVQVQVQVDDAPAGEAQLHFLQHRPEVVVTPVQAFPGALLARPPDARPRPALIVLGGAEGGSQAAREQAPRLASLGYVVLGLPYYSPARWPSTERELPDLPAHFVDIPLENVDAAARWLRQQPGVDGRRIGLYGASKGAEYALLAASRLRWVHSVVAYAPSDVVWEGFGLGVQAGTRSSFSWRGRPLPFVPYDDLAATYTAAMLGQPLILRDPHDRGRALHPVAAVGARIPIERFRGPLLLIAGQDDQLWNAGMMAHNLAERRAAVRRPAPTVALIYPQAGHYVHGSAQAPTTHYNAGQERTGGTPQGNARAQADAWPKVRQFLATYLPAPPWPAGEAAAVQTSD